MRYRVLATDYDGTLAHDGHVDEPTLASLNRFLDQGGKLVLVTGRELHELLGIFPGIGLFERVVVENGAVLYHPAMKRETPLAGAPQEVFVRRLTEAGVRPLAIGRVIVATWQVNEQAVRKAIAELGLNLQIILNKGAVMVLPTGINKASGLSAALVEIGISAAETAAIGDAENDVALLQMCGRSAAVANALPALKAIAHQVTRADHGAGVSEFIEWLLVTS